MTLFVARTAKGADRHHSEDRVFVDESRRICAVADGHGARGRAADLLFESIVSELAPLPETFVEPEQIEGIVNRSLARLFEIVATDRHLRGVAGTTLDIAAFQPGGVWIGHIGDGRVYHVRGSIVTQITKDHTWVAELPAAEAMNHPMRNVLTRAAGVSDNVALDVIRRDFVSGDRMLLCTDAVWRERGEFFVAEALRLPSREAVVERLLDADVRCRDDASVIVGGD